MTLESKVLTAERVAESMIQRGGSFVKALGNALMKADIYNIKKIEEAWPEYWAQYKMLADKAAEEEDW